MRVRWVRSCAARLFRGVGRRTRLQPGMTPSFSRAGNLTESPVAMHPSRAIMTSWNDCGNVILSIDAMPRKMSARSYIEIWSTLR